MASEEHEAVTLFRDYLRIKTVHPKPDYDSAVKFLWKIGEQLNLAMKVFQIEADHPMLLMTWPGTQPTLSSLLLSSHMDVVPVFEDQWKVGPFSAEKLANGDIIARGTQDMKSVSIQSWECSTLPKAWKHAIIAPIPKPNKPRNDPKSYRPISLTSIMGKTMESMVNNRLTWYLNRYLEAIRKLKAENFHPLRTIHILFTTDEELGSVRGLVQFVKWPEFLNLNIGCIMDEGLANPTDEFIIFNGQKVVYSFTVKARGNPGHGSKLIENTAGVKISGVIEKMNALRAREESKLKNGEATMGDILVINLTKLQGGVQINVIPDEFNASFDLRVPPATPRETIDAVINDICSDDGVSWHYMYNPRPQTLSPVDDKYPWWSALSSALDSVNLKYRVEIFSGGTDSRHIRHVIDVPAYGFSPMNNTPVLLHDDNEYLNEQVFLRGIDIYVEIVRRMANVAQF